MIIILYKNEEFVIIKLT